MQVPHFRERGLDLASHALATLNVSLAPGRCRVDCGLADHTFRRVAWHPTEPAEDFSFFAAAIRRADSGAAWVRALIYHPHPETKPAHWQPPALLEVLAESWIAGLGYGDAVELALDPRQIRIDP